MRRTSILLAVAASWVVVILAACGEDAASPTPSATVSATPVASAEPSRTEEPTPSPITADAPEVQQTLALPGFKDFLKEFATAIEDGDVEWKIKHTHFEVAVCPTGDPSATPAPICSGIGLPPPGPGIMMGAWNSEGSMATEEYYISQLRNRPAYTSLMYAIGQQEFGLDLGPSEVGIVVENPGLVTPLPTPFGGESVTSYRVDRIDGEWEIVGVDGGLTGLVPYFYDWYALWDEIAPELS